jgi:predicted amino acid racemase
MAPGGADVMQTEEITIRVDPEVARAYRTAPEQERRKLDLLLSLRLQDALRPGGSLKDLMRDISRKAQERGLTPEILETILREP